MPDNHTTLLVDFLASTDGVIASATGPVGSLILRIDDGHLVYQATIPARDAILDAEDIGVADGLWHTAALTVAPDGTRLYLDGYQVFCGTATTTPADCGDGCAWRPGDDDTTGRVKDDGISVRTLTTDDAAWDPDRILAAAAERTQAVRPPLAPVLPAVALFDRGYEGSTNYRIPILAATPGGILIAGCDQRTSSPQDSPSHINFVIRRSLDGGDTWGPLQRVITSYGSGSTGASVTDGCLVVDRDTGRLTVVIDRFPGCVGQHHIEPGTGMTPDGRLILTDPEGRRHVVADGGAVLDAHSGAPTGMAVDPDGTVMDPEGLAVSNIYADEGPLLAARTCFLVVTTSDDDGATWSEPRHINHMIKEEWMQFCGSSPGTGIQLRRGPHAGRLIIPIYFDGDHVRRMSTAVIYSDDHGDTWHRGASPNDGRVLDDGETIDARTHDRYHASLYESTIVETGDGTVLMLMRNVDPSGRVLASRSDDGGETWGTVDVVDEIPEIFCQPNAIALDADADKLVFCNASELLPFRGHGVLRRSHDGGRTWPWARTITPGHHAYQSLAQAPDGRVLLLWENEWQGLYLSRLPDDWLR